MSFTHTEHWTSRAGQDGDSPSRTLVYMLTTDSPGSDDPFVYTAGVAPAMFEGLPRRTISIDPIGPVHYGAKVYYGRNTNGATSVDPPEIGDEEISFNIGVETKHITTGREHINDLPASPANPYDGAIGVAADDVQGTDIVVPVFGLTITKWIDAAVVDNAYMSNLASLVGKVNSSAWRGWPAGEALFMGASGGPRGGPNGVDYEIGLHMAISQNMLSVPIGSLGGINVKGWEHLWVRMKTDVVANKFVQVPESAHVERVYDSGDFSSL